MSEPSILVVGVRIPEGLGSWATGHGYLVNHAARASDVLERFDKNPTTLVLVQLRLDQLAELSYVARLRELPAGRIVPIVALCRAGELERCKQFASSLRLNLWLPEPLDTIALAAWANPLIHSASGTFTRRRSGALGDGEFTGRSASTDALARGPRPPSSDSHPVPPRPSRPPSSDSNSVHGAMRPLDARDEPGMPRAKDSRIAARPGPSLAPSTPGGPPPAVSTAAWPDQPTSSNRSTPPGLRVPPSGADDAPSTRPASTAATPPASPQPPTAPLAPPTPPPSPVDRASAPVPATESPTGRPNLEESKAVPEYEVPTFDEADQLFADD